MSATITSVQLKDIIIDGDRQRQNLGNIEPLAESMKRLGQIQPIVLNGLGLIAGERRCEAARYLGWEQIEAIQLSTLNPRQRFQIEWAENYHRKPLDWKEDAIAVARFHSELIAGFDPNNPDEECQFPDSWSTTDTGHLIGLAGRNILIRLQVAKALEENHEKVLACINLSGANNVLAREREREMERAITTMVDTGSQDLNLAFSSPTPSDLGLTIVAPESATDIPDESGEDKILTLQREQDPELAASLRPASLDIFQANFIEFTSTYSGPKFHFIHFDPPYGIDHGKSAQGGADIHGGYEDSADLFWELAQTMFSQGRKTLMSEQCHILMWFSMKHYSRLIELITSHDFKVCEVPVIWHKSDNMGILPDVRRQPRRVYETALIISKGDRKIISAVPNLSSEPSGNKSKQHLSEKSLPMLSHFFRMFVDSHTRVLDPTCGSGNALVAAENAGAAALTGLDLSSEHVATARLKLDKTRFSHAQVAKIKVAETSDSKTSKIQVTI